MLKTVDMNSWALMANSITYAGETIVSDQPHNNIPGAKKYIEFAPDLPYLYIPLADYSHWAYDLQSDIYTTTSQYKLECDKDVNGEGWSYCRFS